MPVESMRPLGRSASQIPAEQETAQAADARMRRQDRPGPAQGAGFEEGVRVEEDDTFSLFRDGPVAQIVGRGKADVGGADELRSGPGVEPVQVGGLTGTGVHQDALHLFLLLGQAGQAAAKAALAVVGDDDNRDPGHQRKIRRYSCRSRLPLP